MALFKKIIFIAFVASALCLGIWAYFNLKDSKKPKEEALAVLPDNCLVYLNTSDFFELNKKINSQSLIADKLKLFTGVNLLCNTLHAFDSIFTANSVLQETIQKNTIHVALYEQGLNWLTVFNIKQLGSQELIMAELAKILQAQKKENDVYEFSLNKNSKFYFTLNSGIVLLSNTPTLIESAINKATPKLQKNKDFLAFKNTIEEYSLLSVYVDHAAYLKSKTKNKLDLSLALKKGFSAGNLLIEPSELTINGYLQPDTSEVLSAFYNQKPQKPGFLNLLPNTASSFKAYGFSDFSQLNKIKKDITKNKFWKLAGDSALFNIEEEFYKNAESYLVNFRSRIPGENFVMLNISDTLKGFEQLVFMSDSVLEEDSVFIYKLRSKNLKNLNLFSSFFDVQTQFVALHNSHLFFAQSKDVLFRLVRELKSETPVIQNESFIAYKNQNLSEDFNYMVYTTPNKNIKEIRSFFNFENTSGKNAFENFKHFSFSASNNKTNFKFRWQLLHETETVNKDQNTLWSLTLDAPVSTRTYSFINHITKENELAVQDDNKALYLVNAKGTILWKKNINEKINSKIFTVDIFKNNKYQLLFSSENYLHLIDRNGNYVQGYPVKLPSPATSELSVLDYDNDKDYRLFIACKNNTIYNYSIFGVKVEKFVSVKTDNEVNLPVQYAKVGLSDYLVTVDTKGKIYTFSRKGEGRIGLKNKTTESCSAFYVDVTNNINSTYLVYVDDKNNLINKISFSDKKIIEKLNTNIDSASIKFRNVGDSKAMDIIITKPNAVMAYNLGGILLYEKNIESDLSESGFFNDESQAIYFSFSNSKKQLILNDQLKQKTRSLNATAMPLISNLFNDNKKYLIVPNGDKLNCAAL